MISLSRLLSGRGEAHDHLRYPRRESSDAPRPVMVWNITQACNLRCRHCYSSSSPDTVTEWSDLNAGKHLIDDLAQFGCPVLLFSGGEPLCHPLLFAWLHHARSRGLATALSTNGTLIDDATAHAIHEAGVRYVGISLDGIGAVNDAFRNTPGAYEQTLRGIRACQNAGLKTGLRLTLNRHNVSDLDAIFDLIESESLPRACFYHLATSGRGARLPDHALTHAETRSALDTIIQRAQTLIDSGTSTELLTVGNHADGVYLLQCLTARNDLRASEVNRLLLASGGNASGSRIACIDWHGTVYADQFWRNRPLGSVHERPFSDLWNDPHHPLLDALRDRRRHLTGRCGACAHLDLCNGNLRCRADAATDTMWAPDPACYLTDKEIGIA